MTDEDEPVVGTIIFEDEREKPPLRNQYAELDELRDYIKELQGQVVWLHKAIMTHSHPHDTEIDDYIKYDSRKPPEEYE